MKRVRTSSGDISMLSQTNKEMDVRFKEFQKNALPYLFNVDKTFIGSYAAENYLKEFTLDEIDFFIKEKAKDLGAIVTESLKEYKSHKELMLNEEIKEARGLLLCLLEGANKVAAAKVNVKIAKENNNDFMFMGDVTVLEEEYLEESRRFFENELNALNVDKMKSLLAFIQMKSDRDLLSSVENFEGLSLVIDELHRRIENNEKINIEREESRKKEVQRLKESLPVFLKPSNFSQNKRAETEPNLGFNMLFGDGNYPVREYRKKPLRARSKTMSALEPAQKQPQLTTLTLDDFKRVEVTPRSADSQVSLLAAAIKRRNSSVSSNSSASFALDIPAISEQEPPVLNRNRTHNIFSGNRKEKRERRLYSEGDISINYGNVEQRKKEREDRLKVLGKSPDLFFSDFSPVDSHEKAPLVEQDIDGLLKQPSFFGSGAVSAMSSASSSLSASSGALEIEKNKLVDLIECGRVDILSLLGGAGGVTPQQFVEEIKRRCSEINSNCFDFEKLYKGSLNGFNLTSTRFLLHKFIGSFNDGLNLNYLLDENLSKKFIQDLEYNLQTVEKAQNKYGMTLNNLGLGLSSHIKEQFLLETEGLRNYVFKNAKISKKFWELNVTLSKNDKLTPIKGKFGI